MKALQQKSFKELGVQWIGIELNNTCNIRCTFCPISCKELQRPSNERLMPFETVVKIINEIKKDGTVDHVILNYYGEPFLYPKFEEVLQLCHENQIKVRFGTNGTQFTPANIELIKKYEPAEIVISIQYFLRGNYEKVKGTIIDYDLWLNQISGFLKTVIDEKVNSKIQLAIACNYDNTLRNKVLGLRNGDINLPYPDKRFFRQLNDFIEEFCENRMHVSYNHEKIEKELRKDVYDKYYQIHDNVSFELKLFFDSTNFYKFRETSKVSCFRSYLIINSQGKVLLCCADYIAGTALGDVSNKDIKEILLDKYDYFTNENNEKAEMEICRKCCGEKTYRGLFIRKVYSLLRKAKNKYFG